MSTQKNEGNPYIGFIVLILIAFTAYVIYTIYGYTIGFIKISYSTLNYFFQLSLLSILGLILIYYFRVKETERK
ncbi:MAG: hypothetical protein DRJ32_05635 [Thermoprotei archaeon]|nr:MAG: hypothetical protein DRJ32_05635 [Thermoprotei archaeon]